MIQKSGVTSDAITQVAGEKTIDGTTYTRLTCTNASNPASGVEWWIKETPGESVTLAGWDGHSQLASGIVPPGTVTLDHPLTVSLKPPLNTPQIVTSSASIQVPGDATVHQGQATFNYTLVDDNAAVETSMGTVYGCKHFTGVASATSDLLPVAMAGLPIKGDIWYHPSYGVVAFAAPDLGLGMEISAANDCSQPDSSGHAIVRKVATVDPAHPFQISTYDDCSQEFDADKDVHAQMLLELRWADDAKAKLGAPDTLGPMMRIKFSTVWGEFPAVPVKTQVSALHPEENGQGFNYLYAFVNQAAKNESINGIAYNISVRLDSGASPIRATGRIYYKKYGVSSKRDAGTTAGGRDAATGTAADAAASDARRDAAVVTGPETGSDARQDVPGGGVSDAGTDARADLPAADTSLGTPDAAAIDARKDGASVLDGAQVSTSNLIVNPGAEQAIGSADGTPVVTPGWTATGGATAAQYGVSGYPALTDPGSPTRGLNLFTGGLSDPTSTLTQTIDLASYVSAIDTGKIGFALRGYLGGYDGQDDNVVVSVSFQSATGLTLASASIGPVLSADRGGATGMLAKDVTGAVPIAARSAVVTVTMTRTEGTANDGYADDLSLVLLGVAGGADAGIDGGAQPVTTANLITNGDAEQGIGASDGAPVAVPGWTATGQATLVPYGGTAGYPLLTDQGPPNRGLNFFCGGMADASSALTQTISLSAYAITIDSGKTRYVLQAYLGGYVGQDDNATVSVTFLNAGGTALGSAGIGPVLAADRGGLTGLLPASTTGNVPAGARFAVVTLTLTRVSGTANDGYADSLSLVLSGG